MMTYIEYQSNVRFLFDLLTFLFIFAVVRVCHLLMLCLLDIWNMEEFWGEKHYW